MSDDLPSGGQATEGTLAEKLDRLFRTVHPRGRGEYSNEEVVEGIRQRGGPAISHTYLWQLRKGLRTNPSINVIEALASFFGAPPSYFFDTAAAARIDAQLELLEAMRDAGVRHLALRASDLSPESLQAITDMVERVRELEGLGDAAAESKNRRRRRAGNKSADQS